MTRPLAVSEPNQQISGTMKHYGGLGVSGSGTVRVHNYNSIASSYRLPRLIAAASHVTICGRVAESLRSRNGLIRLLGQL